jgi:hypothetical protein
VRDQRSATGSADAWSLVRGAEQELRSAESSAVAGDTAEARRHFAAADSLARMAEAVDPAWNEPVILRGRVAYRLSRLAVAAPFAAAPLIDSGVAHAADPDALELRGNLKYWRHLLRLESDGPKADALSRVPGRTSRRAFGSTRARPGRTRR